MQLIGAPGWIPLAQRHNRLLLLVAELVGGVLRPARLVVERFAHGAHCASAEFVEIASRDMKRTGDVSRFLAAQ